MNLDKLLFYCRARPSFFKLLSWSFNEIKDFEKRIKPPALRVVGKCFSLQKNTSNARITMVRQPSKITKEVVPDGHE
ncbi:hypothetical protein [Pseudobutyrivibrio sp. YE44]|uniref:hypothetical protein n=1 Tax=Pseudobutyrivibrio sp. YE44 TaxID=1520802 RepID=UPI000B826B07|nr:hypothetical protein [Pseudobutyrivibrio sp. YE44]